MNHEENARVMSFISGLALGALIGATAALLSAPQSGRRTRRRIGRTATRIRGGAADRWDEFSEEVKGKVDDAIHVARKRITS